MPVDRCQRHDLHQRPGRDGSPRHVGCQRPPGPPRRHERRNPLMSAQPNPTGTSGTHTAGASTDAPHIEPSVGTLLKQLMREVPALLTNEIALAKSEMRENMQQTKAGMASVATGGAVLMGGFVMLLLAGVY